MLNGFSFLLRFCWKYNKRYVFYILGVQLVSSLVPLVQVLLPKFIIDELMGPRRFSFLAFWIIVLVGNNFLGGILIDYLKGKSFTAKGVVFIRFQEMLAERMAKCDFCQLENADFLDIKEKAGKFLYANGQGFAVALDSAIDILGKIVVFVGIFSILSTMNIFIVIIFVLLVFLNAIVSGKVKKDYVKWDIEKAPIERKTAYLTDLTQNFTYGKEIRIYNLSAWLMKKISSHLELSNNFYKKQTEAYNKEKYFNTFTTCLRELMAYGYLCAQVVRNAIGIGDFTMYLTAINKFSGAMNDVMDSILNIRQFESYYDALDKYMTVPCKMREGEKLPIYGDSFVWEFRDVSFRYSINGPWILKKINLQIHPGEKLALVGENGAGKSTLIKLLCRLYDPTEGQILLNGTDIRCLDYDMYMELVSAVFQDYKLFAFSIKENVVFGKANSVNDDIVSELLCKSGLNSLLEKLDNGIHSHIYRSFEDDGFEPSGGEGQKISLARALYKDSPLVILDEPTASLDPRSEYEIYQRFNEITEGKSTIYISHRLASCRFCDKILVLEKGIISEMGSHEELMKKNGVYAELFQMQAQYYNESE